MVVLRDQEVDSLVLDRFVALDRQLVDRLSFRADSSVFIEPGNRVDRLDHDRDLGRSLDPVELGLRLLDNFGTEHARPSRMVAA